MKLLPVKPFTALKSSKSILRKSIPREELLLLVIHLAALELDKLLLFFPNSKELMESMELFPCALEQEWELLQLFKENE
jgi:hypothetical protein